MPRSTDFSAMACSIARTFDVLGASWVPLIVRDLHVGVRRFDELQTDLGVARAVLSTRLAMLVDAGLVRRERYSDTHRRDEYVLTDAGAELVPVLATAMAWGDRWLDGGDGPPMRLRHGTCGRRTVPTVCCSACGDPLLAADLVAEPGPGGRAGEGTALIGRRVIERQRAERARARDGGRPSGGG